MNVTNSQLCKKGTKIQQISNLFMCNFDTIEGAQMGHVKKTEFWSEQSGGKSSVNIKMKICSVKLNENI